MRGVAPGRVVVNPLAPSGWGVYLVTDRAQTGGRALIDVVGAALQGGIRAVQLRERDMSARELLALAVRLRESTRAAGAALLINDRVDVALACDADGVHLLILFAGGCGEFFAQTAHVGEDGLSTARGCGGDLLPQINFTFWKGYQARGGLGSADIHSDGAERRKVREAGTHKLKNYF